MVSIFKDKIDFIYSKSMLYKDVKRGFSPFCACANFCPCFGFGDSTENEIAYPCVVFNDLRVIIGAESTLSKSNPFRRNLVCKVNANSRTKTIERIYVVWEHRFFKKTCLIYFEDGLNEYSIVDLREFSLKCCPM